MSDRDERSRTTWQERLEALTARKTREAVSAVLPPYSTDMPRLTPGPPSESPGLSPILQPIGSPWTARLFDGPFYVSHSATEWMPACSLVFVQSADGNTGADEPAALGGGATDKHLIYEGLSRVAADAVLAGAETVRDSELLFSVWHPELVALRQALGLPRHPVQMIATRRGVDVGGTLLFNIPQVPAIVLTSPEGVETMREALSQRPWVAAVMLADDDWPRSFAELRSRGIERVSCVGGRQIARQLIDADLVDDLYLTTSPQRGGEPNTPIHDRPIGGDVIVRKHGTGAETGVVFEHRRLRHLAGSGGATGP